MPDDIASLPIEMRISSEAKPRRPLTSAEATTYTGLLGQLEDWLENGVPVEAPVRRPEPERLLLDTAQREALQRECERLVGMYEAPLPEGDAGLSAAVQRWQEMRAQIRLFARGFEYGLDEEKEIVQPTLTAAEIAFEDMIEAWPVQGLSGIATKLRYLADGMWEHVDPDEFGLDHLIKIIEHEAERRLTTFGDRHDPILVLDVQRQVLDDQLSAFETPCQEETEVGRRLSAVEDQIFAIQPTSAAGAVVQLRLLHRFAQDFNWDGWHDRIITTVIAGLVSCGR